MRVLVPFLLLTFLVCGIAGVFCPMPSSATGGYLSQSSSHPSSPEHHSGDCPEQLSSSVNDLKKLDCTALVPNDSSALSDILRPISREFVTRQEMVETKPSNTPLFLLFSVFLI